MSEHQFKIIEEKDTSDTNEELEVTEPEEILERSKLPVCVIRWVLTGQKKEDPIGDDWLRNNIFHTRVEHKGKSLNLIIDNGSEMNLISQEIVHKLKLPVEKHPQPYKLSWVDDTSISVRHQCLITFSLGQHYVDYLHCDVIPMRACHLLLGHHWLDNRRVKYDGYKNSYSFVFGGRKWSYNP